MPVPLCRPSARGIALVALPYLNQLTIAYNDVVYGHLVLMLHVYVDRLVLIRIERKDESEIGEYVWHKSNDFILITHKLLFYCADVFKRVPIDSAW